MSKPFAIQHLLSYKIKTNHEIKTWYLFFLFLPTCFLSVEFCFYLFPKFHELINLPKYSLGLSWFKVIRQLYLTTLVEFQPVLYWLTLLLYITSFHDFFVLIIKVFNNLNDHNLFNPLLYPLNSLVRRFMLVHNGF